LTRHIAAHPEAIDGTAARGKLAALVEPEAVDERSERIEAAFEWPMVIAALLVIPGDHFTTR
jgi:hypothetical protein